MGRQGDSAKITIKNVMLSNGVIHVIDTVLLPSLEYSKARRAMRPAGFSRLGSAIVLKSRVSLAPRRGSDGALRLGVSVRGTRAMEWLRRVDENPLTERVIMALILINAVTLGLETSASAMERYGPLLITIDRIAIAIFVIEILARLMVQRAAFFREGWNIFDMVVVGVAVAPATAAFSVLRALRVLRLLRLITSCRRCSGWSAD